MQITVVPPSSAESAMTDITNLFAGLTFAPEQSHALIKMIELLTLPKAEDGDNKASTSAMVNAAVTAESVPTDAAAAAKNVPTDAATAAESVPADAESVLAGPSQAEQAALAEADEAAPAEPEEDPTDYHIPDPSATGPFYVVTCGLDVGIFSGWDETSPLVTGVSRAVYRSISSVNEGHTVMQNAISQKSVNKKTA